MNSANPTFSEVRSLAQHNVFKYAQTCDTRKLTHDALSSLVWFATAACNVAEIAITAASMFP